MVYPFWLSLRLARYIARSKLSGRKRYPVALMLEPILRCNLACAGCGRIREYRDVLDKVLTLEECLAAAQEAGAPVVCITGGEPLLHPEIGQIVDGLVKQKYFVFLSSNGLLLESSLSRLRPHPYLSLVLHLDGLAQTHDAITGRAGTFQAITEAIKAAKRAGFQVRTNTTVYKGVEAGEIKELFILLTRLGVDGIITAPAFSYEAVSNDVFMSPQEIYPVFQTINELNGRVRFYDTPIYREFLAGKRPLTCTPWSNPTRNLKGWKSPCYLITDGHWESFAELMEKTPWEKYGVGKDPRCANCMMHCGFEASALSQAGKHPSDLWRLARWNLFS